VKGKQLEEVTHEELDESRMKWAKAAWWKEN